MRQAALPSARTIFFFCVCQNIALISELIFMRADFKDMWWAIYASFVS